MEFIIVIIYRIISLISFICLKPSAITQAIEVVQKVQLSESFTNNPNIMTTSQSSSSRFGIFDHNNPRSHTSINEVNFSYLLLAI